MSKSFKDNGDEDHDDRGAAERAMLWQNNRPSMPPFSNNNGNDRDAKSGRSDKNEKRDRQMLELLSQIRTHLMQIDKERDEVWDALNDHTKTLSSLEDLSTNTEKTYLSLENRLSRTELKEAPMVERLEELERTQQEQSEKTDDSLRQEIFERMDESDMQTTRLIDRIDEAMAMQSRMSRRIDQVVQDKQLMARKLERMEKAMETTRQALSAKAMVLLTDRSVAETNSARHIPLFNPDEDEEEAAAHKTDPHNQAHKTPHSDAGVAPPPPQGQRRANTYRNMQIVAVILFILMATVAGWWMNRNFEQTGNADLASAPIEAQSSVRSAVEDPAAPPQNASFGGGVADLDTEALSEQMDNDPAAVGAMLNGIEPGGAPATPDSAPAAAAAVPDTIEPDGNLPQDIKELEASAFNGDAEAQHDLGAVYTAGRANVAQDYPRAAYWFTRSAEQGIANARYNLGVLYHQGLGVPQNMTTALEWYKKAAQIGHPEAQYNLGIAHIEGIGADYDPELAADHFEAAAASGITEAAYNLGLIYENGLLGQAQPDEALLWYKTAADAGNEEARRAMEELAQNLNIEPEEIDRLVEDLRMSPQSGNMANNSGTTASAAPDAMISQVQEQLKSLGLYNGPASGTLDNNTAAAIRSYQTAHNLDQNGQPSEDLLVHMLATNLKQNRELPELGSRN